MIQRAYLFAEVVSQVVRVDDSVDHRHSVDHDTTVAGCSDYGPQTPRDSGLRNAVTGEWSTGCGRPALRSLPGCLARPATSTPASSGIRCRGHRVLGQAIASAAARPLGVIRIARSRARKQCRPAQRNLRPTRGHVPWLRHRGDMKLAIVGAGIGGLTLALELHNAGHRLRDLRGCAADTTHRRRHQRPVARDKDPRPARHRSTAGRSLRRHPRIGFLRPLRPAHLHRTGRPLRRLRASRSSRSTAATCRASCCPPWPTGLVPGT